MNRKQTWLILTLTVNQILKYHTYSIHNTLFYYISTMIASIGLFFLQWRRCRKLLQGLDVDCKDKVNGSFTCVLIMHFTVFHIICTILSFTHQWDLSLHCKLCLVCEGFTVHRHTIHFTVILITRIITFLFLTNFAAFLILKICFLDCLPQPISSEHYK